MGNVKKSLIWASAIIIAALICVSNGLSDAASFGIVMGLSGAALGRMNSDTGCGRGCLS